MNGIPNNMVRHAFDTEICSIVNIYTILLNMEPSTKQLQQCLTVRVQIQFLSRH